MPRSGEVGAHLEVERPAEMRIPSNALPASHASAGNQTSCAGIALNLELEVPVFPRSTPAEGTVTAMAHWYHQERYRMELEELDRRRRRKYQFLRLWILLSLAAILMLLSGIVSYHLCRMIMNRQ